MADQDSSQKDTYYVAVKVFLEKNGKLFVFKDAFGDWDLPGGRIKKDEFATAIPHVIRRKMQEELGEKLIYTLEDRPCVLMRHERIEASLGTPVRIFALGFRALWVSGEPLLSDMHTEMEWVDLTTFEPEEYFTGGWLAGVEEYMRVRTTF